MMGMESAHAARHSPGLYGVVLVSPRSGSECCSFLAALRKGDERVWSVGEATVGATPEEAAVIGLARLLDEGGAVGRTLDFLIQEMNREVNTVGSKADDLELSQAAIAAKSTLEKLREQVQNIE